MNKLLELYKNYIDYKYIIYVNASGKVLLYNQLKDEDKDNLIIYLSNANTLEFVLNNEIYPDVNRNVLFETSNPSIISNISRIVESYFITADYKTFMDELLKEIYEKKEMKRKHE